MAQEMPWTMSTKTLTNDGVCFKPEPIHNGENIYTCKQCSKSFKTEVNLKTHWLTHSGEKQYKCEQCKKVFTQAGHLKRHMLTHTGEKKHKCAQCKNDRPGDDGTLRSVQLLVFLLGVIDIASTSA